MMTIIASKIPVLIKLGFGTYNQIRCLIYVQIVHFEIACMNMAVIPEEIVSGE